MLTKDQQLKKATEFLTNQIYKYIKIEDDQTNKNYKFLIWIGLQIIQKKSINIQLINISSEVKNTTISEVRVTLGIKSNSKVM